MPDKDYAVVKWRPIDVKAFAPDDWTLEDCERWLAGNAKHIAGACIRAGFNAIETLVDD